jgi:multicomponent Na+:H+ antiporter subunit D
MAKGALFLLVGVIVYRLGSVDEEELRGRGRGLRVTAVLFAVGGVVLAELPPFATFAGKAMIEDDGVRMGFWWMPLLFAATSAVVGASILRVAGRVFLGWGPREPDRFGADVAGEVEVDDEVEHPPHRRTPVLLLIPVAALLAGSLALGLAPGLSAKAAGAGAAFEDRQGYQAAVLQGRDTPPPTVRPEPTSASAVAYGLASGVTAVGLAALALFRRRVVPAGLRRRAASMFEPAVIRFRALQSGHVGDYAAWFAFGAAALGGLFALAVK